jgi:hypothetical protein
MQKTREYRGVTGGEAPCGLCGAPEQSPGQGGLGGFHPPIPRRRSRRSRRPAIPAISAALNERGRGGGRSIAVSGVRFGAFDTGSDTKMNRTIMI